MRTMLKLFVVCGGFLLAAPAGAASQAACADGSSKVLVTGSAIKRCARLVGGYTFDTPSAVLVIGRSDIERSGHSTTVEVLRSQVPAAR